MKYQCPKCHTIHPSERWNAESIVDDYPDLDFLEVIPDIDDCQPDDIFRCPSCGELVARRRIIEK